MQPAIISHLSQQNHVFNFSDTILVSDNISGLSSKLPSVVGIEIEDVTSLS